MPNPQATEPCNRIRDEHIRLAVKGLLDQMSQLATKDDLTRLGTAVAAQIQGLGDRIEMLARPDRPER